LNLNSEKIREKCREFIEEIRRNRGKIIQHIGIGSGRDYRAAAYLVFWRIGTASASPHSIGGGGGIIGLRRDL